MNISRETLKLLLSQAFDCGQRGSYELREQDVEDMFLDFQKTLKVDWEILNTDAFKKMVEKTRIYHSLFGFGIIEVKNSIKYVRFRGFRMELMEDGWPWTAKVKVLKG